MIAIRELNFIIDDHKRGEKEKLTRPTVKSNSKRSILAFSYQQNVPITQDTPGYHLNTRVHRDHR